MIRSHLKFYSATALLIVGIAGVTGFGGCAGGPKVQEFPDTANSADEVQRLKASLHDAAELQVDVLSPSAFAKAEDELKSAVSEQEKGKDQKAILHSVAKGRAQLDRANQGAGIARSNMEEVVSARRAAIVAGAQKTSPKEFAEADDHLRAVTSETENNNLDPAKENRTKLQAEYLNVELSAIKAANLAPIRATIAVAVKNGAEEYAKQSLAIARKKTDDTEAYIVANRHSDADIKTRSADAQRAADHLVKITHASKAGKNITSEEAALRLEGEEIKTQEKGEQLSAAKTTAKGLAVETASLKTDQAFNRSFEAARAEFTSEESEVYRQGDRLVIRLKTLEFPVNQSVLRGSNFPLLAKVVTAIKGFENASVVVEGHTDSVGSKDQNAKLSTERAEAVSQYLVANNAVAENKIEAVGYGFDRPLAPNRTAKGRAQNRRVDVIISPQATVTN